MSLVWNCSGCVVGAVPRNDGERAWLQKVGFGSPIVKLGIITADDVPEWLFRFRFLEQLWPDMSTEPVPVAAIERWIELRTNVTSTLREKWVAEAAANAAWAIATSLPPGRTFD